MICLVDNDIIKKLAICNLLDEAVSALDTSHRDIFVLPTAKYKFGVAKNEIKAQSQFGFEAWERLKTFLDRVGEINEAPMPAETQLFEDTFDIDSGEAILFSASAHYAKCLVATGDKKSLRALASLANAQRVINRISGNVICFEQIILRIIKGSGFIFVRSRMVPVCDCDQVLRAVFGSGLEATEANVCRGLESYIEHLRRETGSLLVSD